MTLEGRRVLYISYNGMLDPLGQSQVLPYLRELTKRGVRFTLLSFERLPAFQLEGAAKREELRVQLAEANIEWHWLRYHQKPSLPATAYDVMSGVRYAQRLVKRNGIEMVHARSHIPATIGWELKKRFKLKLIFDIRGLMAEEYVDAAHWGKDSIKYRLTKRMERRVLAASDGIVTLTERIWPIIKEWEGVRDRHLVHEVIPCCADLQLYRFSPEAREQRRNELGLGNRFTMVYSGSIGSWYLSDRMADFFVELLKIRSDAHFLWMTPGHAAIVNEVMKARGLNPSQYTVVSIASEKVPSYLSACDVGIAFYKPGFSKLATSPVKVTEYLACGLPIVINAGVGDSDALTTREKIGALIGDFRQQDYAQAAIEIERLVNDTVQTRHRAREVAAKLFDLRTVGITRYARLYERVFGLNPDNRQASLI